MVGLAQIAIVVVFFGVIYWLATIVVARPNATQMQASTPMAVENQAAGKAEVERCKVPDFAIAMGHAEKWKMHNNCRDISGNY